MSTKKEMKTKLINLRDEMLKLMESAKTDECIYLLNVALSYKPVKPTKQILRELERLKKRRDELVDDNQRHIETWFNSCILGGNLDRCEDRYNSINLLGKKNIIELTKEIFITLI